VPGALSALARNVLQFAVTYIRRYVPTGRGENCSHSRSLRLAYQQPARMSPTLAVKGKESATARILGSGTSGTCYFTSLTPSNVARMLTRSRLWSLGVAELLIFHPVDTIAKRLMSNKAKVSTFLPFYTNAHDSTRRSRSRRSHQLSSASIPQLPWGVSYSRFFRVSAMPQATKSHNESTSLAANRGSMTCLCETTRQASQTCLENGRER
jgi:hypothetical protein